MRNIKLNFDKLVLVNKNYKKYKIYLKLKFYISINK